MNKRTEAEIIRNIAHVYSGLTLENLFADGERSRSGAKRIAVSLRAELKRLFIELGRTISEVESYRIFR